MKITQERYLALDVVRGLTIAFMIVVNTPGSWSDIYAPLEHAAWNGFTPTDLVFPTFLFVIGNAFAFSMKKLSQLTTAAFFRKVLKRGALIFLIGWLLNAFPFVTYADASYHLKDFSAIRLWGVLQRIGVCYLLAAVLIYYCSKRMLIVVSLGLLLGYWALLYLCGNSGAQYTLAGNAVLKIELLYLPVKNMYPHYDIPFEPLGLLSTLPSVVNVVIGYLAGLYVQHGRQRVRNLLIAGLAMVVAGACWGLVFPINKALWTSSYVVYASGFDLIILAVLMLIIDVYNVKKWSYFFEVFGKNPLFMYILSWILAVLLGIIHIGGPSLKGIIYKQFFTSWLSPKNASLGYALVFMLIVWCIGYIMDRKQVYVRV
jgi:predicted acyltransferase